MGNNNNVKIKNCYLVFFKITEWFFFYVILFTRKIDHIFSINKT